MKWDEFNEAWRDAKRIDAYVDEICSNMADMLVGRLRKCKWTTLERLKRELKDFNMRTGCWK